MPRNLVFAPEVADDLADAHAWYEERRIGLGEDFLTSVDASIERILRHPDMYPIVYEGYRRALTRRFPFAIFYEANDDTITIYGVFHTAQDPAKWRRRLSG